MPMADAVTALHGTFATPSTIFQGTANTATATDYVIDFGAPASGASFPHVTEFPSITEKGYSFPPETVGQGGVEQGVHLIITTAVTPGSMTAGTVTVGTASTDACGTVIATRTFTLAQLEQVGAHYFISVPQASILEFLGAFLDPITATSTTGKGVMWYGPRSGGEL